MDHVQNLPENSDFGANELEDKITEEVARKQGEIKSEDLDAFEDTVAGLFTTIALAPSTFGSAFQYLTGSNKFRVKDAAFCAIYAAANFNHAMQDRVDDPVANTYARHQFLAAAAMAYDYAAQVDKQNRLNTGKSPEYGN